MAWGEKTWQWMGIASDEAFVAAAIAHLGYLGFAFAYVVDRKTGKSRGFQAISPLGLGTEVAPGPDLGHSVFYHPRGYIRIENAPRRLTISLGDFEAEANAEGVRPWDATWPTSGAGYTRTQKTMGMPTTGSVSFENHKLSLDGHALLDWTRGVMGRETSWRWSAGVGQAGDSVVAWNLRTGFDDSTEAENAVWVDLEPHSPGQATIQLPSEIGSKVWKVSAGGLELDFEPQGQREENLNLVLIASRYKQPWGRYIGSYEGVALEGYGVVEEHWALW